MLLKTARTLQQNGEYGNQSVAIGQIVFAADAIASTGVMFKLPPKVTITECRLVNAALGASTTIAINAVGVSGSTPILAAASTVSAGSRSYAGAPLNLAEETDITAVVGGGAATGQLDIVIQYVYHGA